MVCFFWLMFHNSWLKPSAPAGTAGENFPSEFKAPAYTTDVVTISGEIESIENNGYNSKIVCLVSVHNQEDKILINGTAEIMEPKNE